MVKFHYVRDTMIRKCTEHGYFRGSSCLQCKRPGRYLLDDSKEEKLGRFVSGTLRHFPASAGVEMDRFGWVNLNAFCDVMGKLPESQDLEVYISSVYAAQILPLQLGIRLPRYLQEAGFA